MEESIHEHDEVRGGQEESEEHDEVIEKEQVLEGQMGTHKKYTLFFQVPHI